MPSLFNTGVRPAIDQFLLDEAAKVRDYGDYWSASSAGYCQRKIIFERLGVPHSTEDDPRKQRVFTAGHIFHDWIQDITKKAGLSIASEVELQDEDLMIRGHFDDLILVKRSVTVSRSDVPMTTDNPSMLTKQEFDHLILYDYKTQNSRAFTYQKGKGISHFHRMQLGTYMYMLRQRNTLKHELYDGVENLSEARILKISKDDLRMDENQLLWSPELERDVVGFWKTLNGYWKNKTIPKCTCADYEGGFMAREKFNPFFYNGEPCSIDWYNKFKKEKA